MKNFIARLVLAVIRPALELDRQQRTDSEELYLPKEKSSTASAIEAACAEFNGGNLLSVSTKYGMTAKRLYHYIMGRRAAVASETQANPPEVSEPKQAARRHAQHEALITWGDRTFDSARVGEQLLRPENPHSTGC